jgi:chromosomal replication initiator protein
MENYWIKVKQRLEERLPEHSYKMWIEPVHFMDSDDSTIKLSCPNTFLASRIKSNYLFQFQKELAEFGCDDLRIEFYTEKRNTPEKNAAGDCAAARPVSAGRMKPEEVRQMRLPGMNGTSGAGRLLKKGHTFDDFVVGKNSNFAYSASLSLARGVFDTDNILYLLSGTGLGKSHLAQAVGHYILTNNVSEKVYYITAEDFTNEMIEALKNKTIYKFKEKYRRCCDVLILEDIHFLSGKQATQKELALTLDHLLDADKKIIFSGSLAPASIPKLEEALESRLSLGLVTEIDVPDFNTRFRILKKKAADNGYDVPGEVMEFLAQELCTNVRQLESGLKGVVAKGSILDEPIDINLAESVIKNFAKIEKRITVDSIKRLVCKEFSISEKDIVSPSRKQRIVKPRQMAIYLSRKHTKEPLKVIGKNFNRYHATAIYAVNAIEKELKKSNAISEQVRYLTRKIEEGKL